MDSKKKVSLSCVIRKFHKMKVKWQSKVMRTVSDLNSVTPVEGVQTVLRDYVDKAHLHSSFLSLFFSLPTSINTSRVCFWILCMAVIVHQVFAVSVSVSICLSL